MTGRPLVIVTDRVGPDDRGELVLGLACSHQERSAGSVTVITWDGGSRLGLLAGARHREVDAINKWWLPKTLVRSPLTRPLGRALRQARVRWWWRRAGDEPEVVVVNPSRPEMERYVPPGSTVEVVDEGAVGSRGTEVWRPLVRDRAGVAPGEPLISGWGPPTWAAGIDQFVHLASWWRTQDHPGRFVWCHPHDSPPGPEVRHDLDALGVADLITFVAADGDIPLAARGADASVGCARSAETARPTGLAGPFVGFGPDGTAPRFGRAEALGGALRRVLISKVPAAG